MKMRIKGLVAIVTIIAMFTSCRKEINGSGTFITQKRNVGAFTGVESCGDYTVILKQADHTSVELYGENNILPYIETVVTGNELRIYNRHSKTHLDDNGVTVTIHSPHFNNVSLQGSGEISSVGILSEHSIRTNLSGSGKILLGVDAVDLQSVLAGSGTITIHGVADVARHTISGSGDVQAYDLISQNVTATISGSGNCFVNATDYLHATISGSGNVIYIGDQQVTASISGSGTVRKN